jgi:hypothetical protein
MPKMAPESASVPASVDALRFDCQSDAARQRPAGAGGGNPLSHQAVRAGARDRDPAGELGLATMAELSTLVGLYATVALRLRAFKTATASKA